MDTLLPLVLGLSVVALVVAFYLIKWVMGKDTGTPQMRAISDAIRGQWKNATGKDFPVADKNPEMGKF